MNIDAVVDVTDRLFFQHRSQPLNELQREILIGTLESCNYDTIASRTKYSADYVRVAGSQLWSELSEILGTEVTKRNFKSFIEKIDIETLDNQDNFDSAFTQDFNAERGFNVAPLKGNVTINIGSDVRETDQSISEPQFIPIENIPEFFDCFGREEELNLLQKWILEEGDRLIALLGFPGIGKTTLSLKLAEQIKPHFDFVLYRNLRFQLSLSELFTDLFGASAYRKTAPYSIDKKISMVVKTLQERKYLIILDDFQGVLAANALAGNYPKEYESYRLFFEAIATCSHQSCILFCSREKPAEIAQWEKRNNTIRSFELKGSRETAIALFQEQQLTHEESWQNLIEDWQGHPLQLQEMAILIQDIFTGDARQFVPHSPDFLGNNLKAKITEHLDRISESEREVLGAIVASGEVAFPVVKLMSQTTLDTLKFLNAVQSLQRRFCVETESENQTQSISLSPLLQNYFIAEFDGLKAIAD